MNSSNEATWRGLGETLVRVYAASAWRLALVSIFGLGLPLLALYLLRGPRGLLLGVGAAAAVACAATCFVYPFRALLLALFIAFSSIDAYLPGPVTLALLALVSARVFFDVLSGRPLDWGSASFKVCLSVLLVVALTSLLVARRMDLALGQLQLIVMGLMVHFAISLYATNTAKIAAVILAVCLGFVFETLLSIQKLLASGGFGLIALLQESRIGSGGWDANVAALIANCLFPLSTFLVLWHFRGWRRVLLIPLPLLLVVSVLLTASRAGWLVLGSVWVFLIWRDRRFRVPGLVGLGALGIALWFLVPTKVWVRFISLAQLGGIVVDRSLQLRQHALEVATELFLQHPWLGVGLGNLAGESPRFMSAEKEAHNTFVEVAATLGIFGIAAYLAWIWSSMEMLARIIRLQSLAGHANERRLASRIWLSMFVFLAAALTLSVPFYVILWLLLALANAARVAAEDGFD